MEKQLPKFKPFGPAQYAAKMAERAKRKKDKKPKAERDRLDKIKAHIGSAPGTSPRFLSEERQKKITAKNKAQAKTEYHRRHVKLIRAVDAAAERYFSG